MKITNHFEIVSFSDYPTLDDVVAAFPDMGISKHKDGWLIFGCVVED